ncbi:MAG: DNA internalization-related competence protein ComEC/Rec2 [Dehalococcoidia bacterium]
MTLLYLSISWVAGILLGAIWLPPTAILFTGAAPLFFLPFFLKYRKGILLTSLCLFAFFGGALYYHSVSTPVNDGQLRAYNDRGIVEIQGMVSTEPEIENMTSTFSLSAEIVYDGDEEKEISGKTLVRTSRYPEYHYGDILRITGTPETPEQFSDFDYGQYLASQGIYSTIHYPQIELIETGKGNTFRSWIYRFRNSLSASLARSLPEPQCSLAQGILLGQRGNIPPDLNQMFTRTGTAHLLAISGLHLSIITGILVTIGIFAFGKRYYIYIWFALLVIWLYAFLTGLRPPIVRGTIMGSMFLFAELLGRQRNATTALTFAAAIMIGLNPLILWDAGFQLSFLAMAGLVIIYPRLRDNYKESITATSMHSNIMARIYAATFDCLAITLTAILMTLPVIAYHFGIISVTGLPATFFALPVLPGIIISTAIAGIFGLFFPLLGLIAGWFAWLFISYLIIIVKIFNTLPFTAIETSGILLWHIGFYYGLLICIFLIIRNKERLRNLIVRITPAIVRYTAKTSQYILSIRKKYIVPSLLITTILIWTAAINVPDDKLHVSVLDIGQGDAILIQTPDRQDILIDGGPDPQKLSLEMSKKLPFWDRTIELVILTQPQSDHLAGLMEIVQDYEVLQIMETPLTSDSSLYAQWRSLIEDKNIPYTCVSSDHIIELGNNIYMELLNPPVPLFQDTSDDINNNSLVVRLQYNEVSFLLTADIHNEAEYYLLSNRAGLKSTVLKVAHHGSNTSSSTGFIATVDPEIAVVSAGRDNRFNHPHPDTMERLIDIVGTDRCYLTSTSGTIEFITNGARLWLNTEKG